jgi:hypothetical protein
LNAALKETDLSILARIVDLIIIVTPDPSLPRDPRSRSKRPEAQFDVTIHV